MHADDHVVRTTGNRAVDQLRIDMRQRIRILADAGLDLLAQRRVAKIGEVGLVDLEVAAARVDQVANLLGIDRGEVSFVTDFRNLKSSTKIGSGRPSFPVTRIVCGLLSTDPSSLWKVVV
jgi:hypothetical protein